MSVTTPGGLLRRPLRRATAAGAALALGAGLLLLAGPAVAGAADDASGGGAPPRLPHCSFGDVFTGPKCGVWWGAYAKPPEGSGDWYQGLRDLEDSVDREFDLVYRFYDWDATIPDAYQMRAAEEGRMLRVNVTSREYTSGAITKWGDIAAGRADAQIRLHAQNLKRVPGPVYFSFQQEPESLVGSYGTVEEFAAAWRRMHRIFSQENADNVVWTWTVSGSSSRYGMYTGGLYPGDAYVDWVSYDPYNFYACHGAPWETFDQTISGFYDFAMENGFGDKPFMLSEYGSTPDQADVHRRATWFRQSVDAIRDRPNIKAVLYFNSSDGGPLGECDVRVTSDAPTLQAFRAMGRDEMFNQPRPFIIRP